MLPYTQTHGYFLKTWHSNSNRRKNQGEDILQYFLSTNYFLLITTEYCGRRGVGAFKANSGDCWRSPQHLQLGRKPLESMPDEILPWSEGVFSISHQCLLRSFPQTVLWKFKLLQQKWLKTSHLQDSVWVLCTSSLNPGGHKSSKEGSSGCWLCRAHRSHLKKLCAYTLGCRLGDSDMWLVDSDLPKVTHYALGAPTPYKSMPPTGRTAGFFSFHHLVLLCEMVLITMLPELFTQNKWCPLHG